MLGYVKAERPGVLEPPPDGWHDTGDIVTIDPQGFVTIKGRAKRFAKVGGEMISLAAVEALVGDLWPQEPCAVLAVPDARKGERLILATQKKDATRAELMTFAKQQHAADLMIPSEVMIFEKMPMLGSGKVDLVGVAKEVNERIAAKPEAMARAQG
jgi:acyl-[acyl-carrier-protein]-phospholipid O-acyltransferase/long-chain-fatty-acid--[acyl-carrier-protein] ligase